MDDNIKFNLSSFDDIYTEFNNLINIIEDNVDEYDAVLLELEDLYGAVFAQYTNNIEECKINEQKFRDYIDNLKTVFDEVKDTSDKNFEPVSPSKVTRLNTSQIKQTVQSVIEVLDTAINQDLFKESPTTTKWIVDRNRELDDTFFEAMLNPIDEHRQKEAEQTFNYNETLYNNAIDEMEASVSFHSEINELENYLKKIGKFDDLFGNIQEDNLFDAYTMSIVQATNSEKIKFENQEIKQAELTSNYTASDERLDGFHTILDVVSMFPAVGEVADAVNAVTYLLEGDLVNAGLSALALIPVAGSAVTITKHGDELLAGLKNWGKLEDAKIGIKISDDIHDIYKASSRFDSALDLSKGTTNIIVHSIQGDFKSVGVDAMTLLGSTMFTGVDELLDATGCGGFKEFGIVENIVASLV